jgi:hypothetical protein
LLIKENQEMSSGGERPGAGRPKGARGKKTLQREVALAAIKASGTDPLQFWADILANEEALPLRFAAAKELAPYKHPRLSSLQANVKSEGVRDFLDRIARQERGEADLPPPNADQPQATKANPQPASPAS